MLPINYLWSFHSDSFVTDKVLVKWWSYWKPFAGHMCTNISITYLVLQIWEWAFIYQSNLHCYSNWQDIGRIQIHHKNRVYYSPHQLNKKRLKGERPLLFPLIFIRQQLGEICIITQLILSKTTLMAQNSW